jgi:hypothetical protein
LQISHTAGGALRVLLSDSDLSRLGTNFAALREADPQTNAVIRRILHTVFDKEALPQQTALTVEAVPTDDGCLLLITPQIPAAENVYTVLLADECAVLQLQNALRTRLSGNILNAVLHRTANGFYVTVYCEQLRADMQAVLHEFGTVHTGSISAARAAESSLETVYDFC